MTEALTFREAAVCRYALRMLLDRVSHPDQVHRLSGGKFATHDETVISKREVRLLVGKV